MTEPMEKPPLAFVPAQIVWHSVSQMKVPFPKFDSSDLSEEDQMAMDRPFVSSFLLLS